jgi:hypothetical protein
MGDWQIRQLGTTQRYMYLSPAALDAAIRLLEPSRISQAHADILETGGAIGERLELERLSWGG